MFKEGQLLAAGKKLPIDRPYRYPLTITIQRNVKEEYVPPKRHATYLVWGPKLLPLQKYVEINRETASKIKRALADIICKEIKHELMKNNFTSSIDILTTNTFIEPWIYLKE